MRCATLVRLKLPCLWEKSHKRVFSDASQDVVMSFCVAGVALCDIPCVCEVQGCREAEVAVPMGKVAQPCLFPRVRRCGHVVLCGRRGTL